MKSYHIVIKIIFFLLFLVLLAYPNNLLAGKFLNYIYIFFCGSVVFLNRRDIVKTNYLLIFFFLLFLDVLLGNIFSSFVKINISLNEYFTTTFRYFSYLVLMYILINTTNTKNDFIFWIKSFLFGYSISVLIIFLDSYKVPFVEPLFKVISFESKETLDIYFRAYGAYLSPISAGTFLLNTFVIICTSLFYIKLKSLYKNILIILLITTVLALFMTASRTSLIGLIFFGLIFILQTKNRIQLIILALFFGLIIYYSGIIDHYIENIMVRNSNEAEGNKSALEGSGRIDTYINSFKLYFNNRTFLFGVGPSEYAKGDGTHSFAHNGFISIILVYGMLGTLLFLNLLKTTFNYVYKNQFLKKILIYYTIVNCISFISSDGPVTHFWIINFICFLYFTYYTFFLKINTLKNN